MIILDTHALLWVAQDEPRLGRQTRRLVDRELPNDGVAYCALSIWEIELLVHSRRLRLAGPPLAWRSGLLAKGFIELATDGLMAATAASFFGALRDPMDCLIAASALVHDATLVTADARILAWTQGPRLHDASS